ncbi:hypothetical protein ACFX2I_007286 [Malus domestica]|uniref:Uncharacterized protein n=1 Tax=Malus domestica TaxID=3750 RepID=A0A498IMV6_MALDO|nr:uncharacterized protein LOC103448371 [Malus domestica]RXH82811.1 hypothetical protein DVH24_003309 [Malus domestica]
MGGHIFLLRAFSSRSRSTILKSLAACHYTTNQRYSSQGSKGEHHHGHTGIEERAPSTAEEFKRVAEEKRKAEEKLKVVEQGVAGQTADKAYDGTEEAILGDSNVESVKNRYKEHEPGADYRRRPHDD